MTLMEILRWLFVPPRPECCSSAKFDAPAKPDKRDQAIAGRSGWSFSARSLKKLASADPRLQSLAHRALALSVVDFGVIQGARTAAEQRAAVNRGASQTLDSKHIKGDAIDIAAFVGGRLTWDGDHYLKIATAFVYAAKQEDLKVRWGGAWHIPDIRVCAAKDNPGETMVELYKEARRQAGRKPFLDLGHFELN